MTPLSGRLQAIVDALPLQPDSRVLEIGCGSGAAARAVAARLSARPHPGHRPIRTGHRASCAAAGDEIASGRMAVRAAATTPDSRLSIDGSEALRGHVTAWTGWTRFARLAGTAPERLSARYRGCVHGEMREPLRVAKSGLL
jgi:hypothetical protein